MRWINGCRSLFATHAFSRIFHSESVENDLTDTRKLAMPLKPEVRQNIFTVLKEALARQCPPMVCAKDTAMAYEIIGNKPVPYGSTKKMVPGMYFSSVVARKDMVSFYFFPLYSHERNFRNLAPTLMKCLKGKSCFNFKKEEEVVEKELNALLKKGIQSWKQQGYMR